MLLYAGAVQGPAAVASAAAGLSIRTVRGSGKPLAAAATKYFQPLCTLTDILSGSSFPPAQSHNKRSASKRPPGPYTFILANFSALLGYAVTVLTLRHNLPFPRSISILCSSAVPTELRKEFRNSSFSQRRQRFCRAGYIEAFTSTFYFSFSRWVSNFPFRRPCPQRRPRSRLVRLLERPTAPPLQFRPRSPLKFRSFRPSP